MELASARRELDNLRAGFDERAKTRGFLERRLATIAELEPNLAIRLGELDEKATAARAARATTGARLRVNSRPTTVAPVRLRSTPCARIIAGRSVIFRESEKRSEHLKDELTELMREAAVVRGRLGDLSGERADLEQQLHVLAAAAPELADAVTQAEGELRSAETRLAQAREEVVRRESRSESAESEVSIRAALEHHAQRVAAAREAYRGAIARAPRIMPNGAGERLRGVLQSLNGDRPATDPAMLLDVVKARRHWNLLCARYWASSSTP